MRLFKTLADMAKCINQLTFAHLAVQPFAIQGGDSEQNARRSVGSEIEKSFFRAQATSSGTVWENSLIVRPSGLVYAP